MQGPSTFSHADIDRRIFRLVEACVQKIDLDQTLLSRARAQVKRWSSARLRQEWETFLSLPWPQLRAILLEKSERGDRIRQSAPFGGFLTNQERMHIIKISASS
jgi:hypothetical protein